LVMPSKLTGIMASGRAVVATADEGTQLATALAGRGLVTPPGDADAFAAAVVLLADDRELRSRMGHQGRKYAVAHLDRDAILLRFEHALMEARGRLPLRTQTGLAHSQDSKLPLP
jgi:colanic acid biosynthesis glycosyl transferase WcaI